MPETILTSCYHNLCKFEIFYGVVAVACEQLQIAQLGSSLFTRTGVCWDEAGRWAVRSVL